MTTAMIMATRHAMPLERLRRGVRKRRLGGAAPVAMLVGGLVAAGGSGIGFAQAAGEASGALPAVHAPAERLAAILHAAGPALDAERERMLRTWRAFAGVDGIDATARGFGHSNLGATMPPALALRPASDFLSEPLDDPDYDFAALDALLAGAVADGRVAGCSVAILHRGEPVFVQAYGLRDIDDRQPFTFDTICRIASSTKWVCGASVVAAVDDGLFAGLDDPVGLYVPGFLDMNITGSSDTASPTIAECFAHTAGMNATEPATTNPFTTLAQAAAANAVSQNPLGYAPGARCEYDSNSMQVTGYAVEVVSPQNDYVRYLRERLLLPMGMPETDFNISLLQIPRLASIYFPNLQGDLIELDLPPIPTTNPLIAGGLYSTLPEYARFMLTVRNGGIEPGGERVLSEAVVEAMLTDQTEGAPIIPRITVRAIGYGVGNWTHAEDAGTGRSLFNTSPGAFGTLPWLDRQNDIVGVFFVQSLDPRLTALQIDVVSEATRAVLGGG